MATRTRLARLAGTAATLCAVLLTVASCGSHEGPDPASRTFDSPEDAARALAQAVKSGRLEEVQAVFGPDGQALVDSSDPDLARRNRDVFAVAFAERWTLDSPSDTVRVLVIGNEQWPFPIPIVREGSRWRFDTAAGREEILARRIGRNEIAAIRACSTYVVAQRLYARDSHDGRPAQLYAAAFRSQPGKHDGLHWEARRNEKRSPLGDLVAQAEAEGRLVRDTSGAPAPFHGYYFKILTSQGAAARGGPRDYMKNGQLSGGFALVAWPARYDVTGVMTFIVNNDGVVHEKDLGPDTDSAARAMTAYNPDASWTPIR